MSIVKHLFALGILVSPIAAAQADDSSPQDANVAAADAASGQVQVSYTNPDKFLDASPQRGYGGKQRDEVLRKLQRHMESQGVRYLKPGQTLKIEVLDLDLAGRVEWWNPNAYDVRIMRDIDSPSMKVRYSLEENGAVVSSGEEWISDHSYLMGINTLSNSDSLKYEKTMLNDWFRNRFGKTAHG